MDEEISALIALLGDAQYDAYKLAAKKLRRIGLAAAPALRSLLSDPNPVIVVRAVRLIGEIGDTEAASALQTVNTSGFPDVAAAVEGALLQLKRFSTTDEVTRKAVAEIQLKQAVKRQTQGLGGWKPPVTEKATSNTGKSAVTTQRKVALTLPLSVEGLLSTLASKDHARRVAATEALVAKGPEAVPGLVRSLENPSLVVRLRTIDALGQIGDDAALPNLAKAALAEQTEEGRAASANAILRFVDALQDRVRPELVDAYIDLVRTYHAPIRAWLPAVAATEAAQCLEALAKTAPSPDLRRALASLKGFRPLIPAEFVAARRAIEEATATWSALPVPAEEPVARVENLPTPATSPVQKADDLPTPAADPPPPIKKKRPPMPGDAPSLIALLASDDEESARLAEGTLLMRLDSVLSEVCAGYASASARAKPAIVRILCAKPSRFAVPTMELALTDFPNNTTLRRTLQKLNKP